MPAPVSLCMIVKNVEGQIAACLQSIRPFVTEICVVDTGSTDKTPEIVKEYADKFEVFTDCNNPETGLIEDFALARNKSFSLATQSWLMWIDGDDEVENANKIVEVIEEYEAQRVGDQPLAIMFPYEYSHDNEGNVNCLHYRERLVSPKDAFKWSGPVHEVLTPVAGAHIPTSEKVRIVHRRERVGGIVEPGRNLRILKAHYAKHGESDVRQLYYLGLEYGNNGDVGNAIKFHKRYVELSGWDDEKFLACLKIAEHYQGIGDSQSAIEWALKSLTVREGWAEAYFLLSRIYYFMAQQGGPDERRCWEKCVHFARIGLQLPPTRTILFVNPLERTYEIHKYLNMALNSIGDVQGALDSALTGLRACPDDKNLLLNKRIYESHLAKVTIEEKTRLLVEHGEINSVDQRNISDVIHGRVKSEPEPESDVHPVTSDSGLDIVFYVGPGAEPWSPSTMQEGGIGGSETAVAEMGKRLVQKGHSVRVFGDCAGMEKDYDGVPYLHYDKYKDVKCDIMVTSRRPHVVDDTHNLKSKVNICWVHDVHCGPALTHTRALRIDKFFALSAWHRSFFLDVHRFVHPDQVIVTRNGIDLTRFDQEVERNPHKAVYSSSPDRGLEVAIKVWPIVRERIPDAELHVFYGFKTWEASAHGNTDQLNLIAHLKGMLEAAKDHGVVFRDRVNQKELAREFLSSGVWAYPTWFSETSCITAMEAQAAGLRIIASPIAALNETVGERGKLIPGDWLSNEYQAEFINSVVDAMNRSDDKDRVMLQRYARENFGWDSLADEWDGMLKNILEEVELNVVPPYKAAV